MSRALTVQDPRAAAVFTQSHQRRILLQFAKQPRSISEVAQDLQIDVKKLHQLVTKLHRLGLVVVAEVRQRAGRAMRLYQASAQRFFIPSAVVPVPFSRGLAKELREAVARDALQSVKGMEFSLDADGRVSGQVVEKTSVTFVPMDSWRILRLNATRASQLKQELTEVLERFQQEPDSGGRVYLIHASMALRRQHSGATDNQKPPSAS